MKNTLRLIFIGLSILPLAAFAQDHEVRNLATFTQIGNSTSGDIYLTQGSPQHVEIIGKKDLIANVDTEISNGQLKIQMKNHHGNWFWHDDDHLKIYITAASIDAININGSGDLVTQGTLTGNNIVLSVNGSGTVKADLDMKGLLNADVRGSGDMTLTGKSQTLKSYVSGSGDIDLSIQVATSAEFDVSGSGDIKVTGKANRMDASISGSGDLDAADFETDKSTVNVSGSGDAHVFARLELDATTSGSGDISYKGHPPRLTTHNSGNGSVSAMQ